jgi:hypothetical protein
MSEEKEKHPWFKLNDLIQEFSDNRESYSAEKLQGLREEISLQLFFLSDSFSVAIASYDQKEHIRKTKAAEREQFYRGEMGADGKHMTIAEASNLARIDCAQEVEDCKEALRQKKRAEIVLIAVQQILHSLSSRLGMLKH